MEDDGAVCADAEQGALGKAICSEGDGKVETQVRPIIQNVE